ncbi:hypothetical protein JCGZ_06800 [Jatropha curcas]|uniref:Uncharacterized protein n=1 Tax=Jatropha curcas TaxID=180498 RepID=A0A067KM82_JATCU|nr:hypothetical protein JCGZ_06800 [Jatropha curcas]
MRKRESGSKRKSKIINYLSLDSQVRKIKPQWSNKKKRSPNRMIDIHKKEESAAAAAASSSSTFSGNYLPCLSEIAIPEPIPDFSAIDWDENSAINFFDDIPQFDYF